MNQSPYLVGICGGSGSGKTYMLDRLLSKLPPDAVTLVSQDNYYKKLEDQKQDENGLVNFDHPESLRLQDFLVDVKRIMEGETLVISEYTFNNPAATAREIVMKPARILIIEGLFIYHLPEMVELIDLKVFIEAEEYIRLTRRLRRDAVERGYGHESVLRDYEMFVAPMYHRFIAPTRHLCDLIIPNNKHINKAVEVMSDHLLNLLNGKQK